MSRWRPAAAKSSAYITAEGHARLKAEFEHLWRERRPEVVRALAEAAAEGESARLRSVAVNLPSCIKSDAMSP